ncbi:MAG: Short-chain dehydrogenase/reductase SDR [Candidatus Woesebacteria bacterium GW2011_GWB1_38_8]|uniref:Short-chain dehydrogenase/reductase SDR n=1 Tax=Candidatus Woesebacteria bacterium GW2011_GWB1_38_8 TaxID=1618570 RepID=A0A0G0P5U8_9BACT|nr:MAG: Short-chain dehydrogenase/reductase SDR [Candidatus Woesebacteria bacterium GW2011_GWB1_38_8]
MNIKDKVVLITGSNQGLGKVLAKKVANEGAKVILLARRKNLLKEVKKEILREKGVADYFVCDIRDSNRVKETVKKITKNYKKIDILVNNAGVWTDDESEKKRPELRKNAFDTNVFGHVQVTEEILPHLNKNESIIINTISTAGVPDIPSGNNLMWKSYGASKWGMVGYTQALRESLRDTNTKVIQYFPGGFESNLYENAGRENPHNQPWMMKTEDVADIIIFALTRPKDVYMEKIVVSKKK